MDARGIGNEHRTGAADEEPALNHADDAADALLQPCRIGDRAEAAVEDVVAAVGEVRLLAGRVAPRWNTAELSERDGSGLPAELSDLYRHRSVFAELVD